MSVENLVRRYAASRDPSLREEIVKACTPLIRLIAFDLAVQGLREDLIQVGYLGLLAAIAAFDPSRGVRFETYARPMIRGGMLHYLRDNRDLIRKPRWLAKAHREIEQTVGRYIGEQKRFPSVEELAAELNIEEKGILEILKTREATYAVSLEALEEHDDFEINRRLIRHKAYASFQLPIEDRIVLFEAIDKLSALQRQVVYRLFYRDMSQPKVAASMGISQRHVSRVLASALSRLRELLTST